MVKKSLCVAKPCLQSTLRLLRCSHEPLPPCQGRQHKHKPLNSPAYPSLPSTQDSREKNQVTSLLWLDKAIPQLPDSAAATATPPRTPPPPPLGPRQQRRSWALWQRQFKHTERKRRITARISAQATRIPGGSEKSWPQTSPEIASRQAQSGLKGETKICESNQHGHSQHAQTTDAQDV